MRESSIVASLFAGQVCVSVASVDRECPTLLPEEAVSVVNAVAKRRREFAVGRHCAREALARLGIQPCPIPSSRDATPIWPSGVRGSISHGAGLCAVAVTKSPEIASIGLDVETADRFKTSSVDIVCSPQERRESEACAASRGASGAKLLFSAKESIYKAVYVLTQERLEFRDVYVRLNPRDGSFAVRPVDYRRREHRLLGCVKGRFAADGQRVYTAVTVASVDFARLRRTLLCDPRTASSETRS